MTDKEILNKNINFRSTEKMYMDLIKYLETTKTSISELMRHITYDYLRFKKVIDGVKEDV
ncbi:hypothetical protein LCGC14_1677690 [marine sediment metagenome]|uniref:Uncharacterized protein n=1 Tax=marine sediment metagenome TaxID=412755 RepID=A0A0F9HPM6_9ZZZZ